MVMYHQQSQSPQDSTCQVCLRQKRRWARGRRCFFQRDSASSFLAYVSAYIEHHFDRRFNFNSLPGDPSPGLILIQCIFPSFLLHDMSQSQLRVFCFLISDIYDDGNIYDAWRGPGSERRLSFCCPCKWDLSPACFCQGCKKEVYTSCSLGWHFFFFSSNLCIQAVD